MGRLVMKFGGTSLSDIERIRQVARHIVREVESGEEVAVVVSAMAGETDALVAKTREASPLHDAREYDVVVASGEQISAGLLAIVLQDMGVNARSWQGWQIPLLTDGAHGAARIENIAAGAIAERLSRRQVAIVTGFQGIGPDNRITTLGRGGSDTSAVALAAALDAHCDIYTDVDGIYTSDPRIVAKARKIDRISYEEMLEFASLGARVLQTRSVVLAMAYRVRLRVRSSFEPFDAPDQHATGGERLGTLLCNEDKIVEKQLVTGITHSRDEAKVTLFSVPDRPGVSSSIFSPLAEAGIDVDMIVQNISEDGERANVTFTLRESALAQALRVIERRKTQIGFERAIGAGDVAKISVVGLGMHSHAGVAARMFAILAGKNINILAITTSEIKISVLIDAAYTELAVRTLHSAYGLDREERV
ncbi:MAG: aspartate kinase [Hyphomicrobiales bacterium]